VNKEHSVADLVKALPEPWKEVRLGDGPLLHALAAEVDPEAPWLIYLHGNGENLASLNKSGMLKALLVFGHNVLVLDYPGLGLSEGEPSEETLTHAGYLAYDWVSERTQKPISLVGRSLGAAVAVQVAERKQVGRLILISPWTELRELVKLKFRLHKYLPDSFFAENEWDSLHTVVSAPYFLILHGTSDTLIPTFMGRELAEAHNAGFYGLEGLGHNDIYTVEETFALLYQALNL